MSKYKFIYLTWLLPAYLLFLTLHQVLVFYSIGDTYTNGDSYVASVVDFRITQIAAQTNGYVVLKFVTNSGEEVQQKLSLPVEMAEMINDLQQIPIRYQKGTFENIVMIPTYKQQRSLVLSNIGIALLGFLITLGIAWTAHKYATRKIEEGEQELIVERVD